jgi:hypothetical protein
MLVYSVWFVHGTAISLYLYTSTTGWSVQCNICLLWSRNWDFKCLLYWRGCLQLLRRRCNPVMRKVVFHKHLPPNRVRLSTETAHRIDVHCVMTEVSCCLGLCRRYPLTCDLKVTNTRHVHPWISKRVLKRKKERVRMCMHWCVGGIWNRVAYGQLADSSWHLYYKSVVFSWMDRLMGLHFL